MSWLLPAAVLTAQQRVVTPGGKQWEVLEGCRLAGESATDGDSFHVQHGGREYIFRLYFVDAPEASGTYPERIQDQAAFFGISTNAVLELGHEAAKFTRERLQGSFTIITRWQNALGMSKLARFYGIVLKDGENLAALLVEHGLARIHGPRANWPDGPRSTLFVSQLQNLELHAKEQRLGAWNEQRFEKESPLKPNKRKPPAPKPPLSPKLKNQIDLNEATYQELMHLPGIGKTLAERIIAHRPYRSVEDLKQVRGIGDKTFVQLKPLVCIKDQPVP